MATFPHVLHMNHVSRLKYAEEYSLLKFYEKTIIMGLSRGKFCVWNQGYL